MPRSACCDYCNRANYLAVDCHLQRLNESIAQLQIRASNLRCNNRDQVHMVKEEDLMIHIWKDAEVSEEHQDVEANFTSDTFQIVEFYLDSGAISHVTRDHFVLLSFQVGSSSVGGYTANGVRLFVVGKDTLCIDSNKSVKHILYVFRSTKNFLSVVLRTYS